MVRRLTVFLLFSLILLARPALATGFSASVDRKQISEQDTFTLILRYEAQAGFSSPDLDPLQQDFQLLNQQRSNQFRSINGKTESFTEWTLTLTPKRTGQLTIPPLAYDGEHSDPITIQVSKVTDDVKAQQEKEFFFDIRISQQPYYYVQGQILYTEKLYFSVNHDNASLSEFKVTDARVQSLGDVRQYTTVIRGQRFGVYERRYAIFPEVSGELVIPGQRFNAIVNNPYDRRSRNRQAAVVSKPIHLQILPIPDNYPQAPWLPAADLQLSESFSADLDNWRAGEPVTRTITLTARGLPGSQLPAVPLPAIDQLRYYPDQTQQSEESTEDGLNGTSVQTMALVPTRAGTLVLPEIRIPWWNSREGKIEYAVLPAHTARIQPARNSAPAADSRSAAAAGGSQETAPLSTALPTPPTGSSGSIALWWWLLPGLSLLLNLVLVLLLMRRHRQKTATEAEGADPQLSSPAAWKALTQACRGQDAAAIHQALLQWANASALSAQPLVNLHQLSACYSEPTVKAALAELDAELFSGHSNSACNSQNLLALLKQHKPVAAAACAAEPSLYPAS